MYYFIDDIRYKAQLQEENSRSRTAKYRSARAAQVHWLDLLNVVSSRLGTDRANVKKKFTLEEEAARASSRSDWTLQFYRYSKGMEDFDDIEYHQDELRRTLIVAAVGHKRALDVYKKASDDLYRASVASINKRRDESISTYNAYYESVVDAHKTFNEDNKTVEELLPDAWVTDWATFNYIMPCAEKDTPVIAIVVNGTNSRRLLKYEYFTNDVTEYTESVSIAFDDMIARCAVIAVPKSGLSATVGWGGDVFHYREWWMSENTPRTDEDEIIATIDLVNLAFDSLPEAHIYLVYGADEGELAKKVMDRLRDDPNENIFKIYGHITVDTKTGEYIGHNLDGTEWASNELDPIQKNK